MKQWMQVVGCLGLMIAGCGDGNAELTTGNPNTPNRLRPGNVSQFLTVDDPKLRAQVARNLGNMGERAKPVIPDLEKLLDDPDNEVREAAQEALDKIRGEN